MRTVCDTDTFAPYSIGYLIGNYPDGWLLQHYPSGKVLAISRVGIC